MKSLWEIGNAARQLAQHAHDVGEHCDVNDPLGIRVSQLAAIAEELCGLLVDVGVHLEDVRDTAEGGAR